MINFAVSKKEKEKTEKNFDKNLEQLAKEQNVSIEWLREMSNKTVIVLAVYKLTKDLKANPYFLSVEEIAEEIYHNYFKGDVDKKFTDEKVPELLKTLIKEGTLTIENLLTEEGKEIAEKLTINVPEYINERRTIQ